MELLNSIIGIPYMFHCLTVSGVLLGAILLFVFGFKSTEEPSFNKTKNDSKLNAKKKKTKEKKSVSGSPKTIVVSKTKTSKSEDKGRKNSALKDSKNVNIDSAKNSGEEFFVKERKKKGKENMDVDVDSNDDEGIGGWERALSRKDKKNKKSQTFNEVSKGNSKESNYSNSSAISKKESENTTNKSAQKEKKQKLKDGEDLGVWQEAKSGKKRRKIQKEA